LFLGNAEPPREPLNVGVDDDALNDLMAVLENDVGRFPADTRELGEFIHRIRHRAVVVVDNGLTGRANVARLVVVVGDRVEILGEFLLIDGGVLYGAVVFLEEIGGNRVNSLVGTLRREDNGDQQFEPG